MQQLHNDTDITLKNSFEQTQFIDWRTQPRNYKTYPTFFRRFHIDEFEELQFIKNFGKITTTKKYGKEEVNLRANPSAGGLYPCEVYIQIRGVKGVLSGIYHYEPLFDNLTLIHELSNDGLEFYFKENSSKKFIILISSVYFRSSWKYDNRAVRYLLLDCGHQIGAISTALNLEGIEHNFDFNFDRKNLNEDFGFDNNEFLLASIIVDNEKETKPKKLREKLISVCATDYFIKNEFIEEFSKKIKNESFKEFSTKNFFEDLKKDELQNSIENRRSIRGFKKQSITKKEFQFITSDIFTIANDNRIDIYLINNNVEGLEKGSYKNVTLLKEGDFKELATQLAFNQKLGGDSCFTLFYTSKTNENYMQNYIFCSYLAHIISLKATFMNIGSSGIGAFFDDKCKEFFETNDNILYLQAIGK